MNENPKSNCYSVEERNVPSVIWPQLMAATVGTVELSLLLAQTAHLISQGQSYLNLAPNLQTLTEGAFCSIKNHKPPIALQM